MTELPDYVPSRDTVRQHVYDAAEYLRRNCVKVRTTIHRLPTSRVVRGDKAKEIRDRLQASDTVKTTWRMYVAAAYRSIYGTRQTNHVLAASAVKELRKAISDLEKTWHDNTFPVVSANGTIVPHERIVLITKTKQLYDELREKQQKVADKAIEVIDRYADVLDNDRCHAGQLWDREQYDRSQIRRVGIAQLGLEEDGTPKLNIQFEPIADLSNLPAWLAQQCQSYDLVWLVETVKRIAKEKLNEASKLVGMCLPAHVPTARMCELHTTINDPELIELGSNKDKTFVLFPLPFVKSANEAREKVKTMTGVYVFNADSGQFSRYEPRDNDRLDRLHRVAIGRAIWPPAIANYSAAKYRLCRWLAYEFDTLRVTPPSIARDISNIAAKMLDIILGHRDSHILAIGVMESLKKYGELVDSVASASDVAQEIGATRRRIVTS